MRTAFTCALLAFAIAAYSQTQVPSPSHAENQQLLEGAVATAITKEVAASKSAPKTLGIRCSRPGVRIDEVIKALTGNVKNTTVAKIEEEGDKTPQATLKKLWDGGGTSVQVIQAKLSGVGSGRTVHVVLLVMYHSKSDKSKTSLAIGGYGVSSTVIGPVGKQTVQKRTVEYRI